MKTMINNIAMVAILMLVAMTTSNAAAQTITATMKNGTVHTYTVGTTADSVRYVGGKYGTATGEGIKIYPTDTTVSIDLLYSQMQSYTETGGPVDTPVFSPAGGTINATTTVTITCGTSGATIYYTTDGTTPSSSNFAGTGSYSGTTLTVSATTTVKAIAVKDGVSSSVATVTFTYSTAVSGNNTNANITSSYWTQKKGNMSYTPATAGFYRLEVPRIKDSSNSSWVQKSTSAYGVTFALEWDNSKVANRWTCYQMHAGNMLKNVSRDDDFKEDTELPSSTRSTLANYKSSGYSRGHLCPSYDRLCSTEQNHQTFYLSNMQPQWQDHNGGQWEDLEGDVQTWAGKCDTLYVVKAGTIDNITLNGTTQSGVFDFTCNSKLPVPKYFYMALLAYDKSSQDSGDGTYHGTFHAIGIWTKHYNGSQTSNPPVSISEESAEYITIDELETRTGIDFFCNLPDDIEATVEATKTESYWITSSTPKR